MKKLLTVLIILAALTGFAFANGDQEAAPQESAAQETAVSKADVVADAVNAYFANMPSHIYKIPQKDFVDMVKAGEDMAIIDIRSAEDYAKGHATGAVNVPWGTDIAANLQYIPQNKPVMVYCYSGQTAGQTVMLLNAAGIPARSVNLGWNFGISKVEGVDAIIETAANDLDTSYSFDVDPAVAGAVKAYFDQFASLKGTPFASNIVSEENAKKILDAGDSDVLFVSVRKPEHYAEGHIDGAVNIPWGKGMQENFSKLPKDKKLIVYCYTGQTAGQTVAGLKMLGFDAVSLKGGMGMPANAPYGWANKGYPVVK